MVSRRPVTRFLNMFTPRAKHIKILWIDRIGTHLEAFACLGLNPLKFLLTDNIANTYMPRGETH